MGSFADSSKRIGDESQAGSSAYATGGTITGSPVFNNGDGSRITTAASANSAGGSGAAGMGLDFKVYALMAGVALVWAVVWGKVHKKPHGVKT